MNGHGGSEGAAEGDCASKCTGPYGSGTCYDGYCENYGPSIDTCEVQDIVVQCTDEPSCEATGNFVNCVWQDGACNEADDGLTFGCWGPGEPTATPCPGGACPTRTPTPTTLAVSPTPTSGSACSAGQWGSCGSQGCGSCYSAQCNGSGTGWNCVWNPGTCCPGGGGTPTPTPPGGATNTPTPTPVTGQCAAPVPRDPPTFFCSDPPSNGSVTWEWNVVANANEYELIIFDDSGSIVANLGWQSAAAYNCNTIFCRYSTAHPIGTYRSRIRARGTCTLSNSSFSQFISVDTCPAPTPTPTTPAGQCAAPVPRNPPAAQCAACLGCLGQVTWEWDAVTNATEYELIIRDGGGGIVNNFGWQPAVAFGCAGGGVCSYATTHPTGSYRSQIRARGTCTESIPSTSSLANITYCSGSVEARTKRISTSDTSCAAIDASTDYAVPADMSINPALPPGAQTQTDENYVTWANAPSSPSYTLSINAPSGYVIQNACWRVSNVSPSRPGASTGTGLSAALYDGETLTWYGIGYSFGTPWVQTQGGDVFAQTDIEALMADTVTPREFNTTLDGFHGTVHYGGSYDFDPVVGQSGAGYASQNGWLVNESGYPLYSENCYQKYLERLDLTTTTPTSPGAPLTEPASSATPYYYTGNVTTTGTWNITNGENVIVVVDGDLTIGNAAGNSIRRSGTGFVAFIVNGNITVNSGVGGTFNSTTPNVEGFYCSTGTFASGATTSAARARLVGRGTFIANSFLLQRDLDSVSENHEYSSELFIYDPQLPFVMPDTMKDLRVRWTEVAP